MSSPKKLNKGAAANWDGETTDEESEDNFSKVVEMKRMAKRGRKRSAKGNKVILSRSDCSGSDVDMQPSSPSADPTSPGLAVQTSSRPKVAKGTTQVKLVLPSRPSVPTCPVCDKPFSQPGNVQKHLIKVHKVGKLDPRYAISAIGGKRKKAQCPYC